MNTSTTDCCIVGAGPGGMVLGLLLARRGVRVTVLEAHQNFDREFRGDTVHPSTLELLDDLGLMDRLRRLPHIQGNDFPIHTPDGGISAPVRRRLPTRYPESMAVPQAELLSMLAEAAGECPTFRLETRARVDELLVENDAITGVRYRGVDGTHEVRAQLVVGADGRFSKVRQLADLPLVPLAQGFDLLWLRLPKADSDPPRAYGLYPRAGSILVVSDRMRVWQLGLGVPKGTYQRLRQAGLVALRARIAEMAPWVVDRLDLIESWNQLSLLVVAAGRVGRWHRPGLLLIGDAAHVMSPVFGVGINYAIQDAIVAAKVLGPRLLVGDVRRRDLARVQRRRQWPTRVMQWMQTFGEHQSAEQPPSGRKRLEGRLLELPPMTYLRSRLIAFGGWAPERLHRGGFGTKSRGAPAGTSGSRAQLAWKSARAR